MVKNSDILNCVYDSDYTSSSFNSYNSELKNQWSGPTSITYFSIMAEINMKLSSLKDHMLVYENVEKILKKIEEIDDAIKENQIRLDNLEEDADGSYYTANISVLNQARKVLVDNAKNSLDSIVNKEPIYTTMESMDFGEGISISSVNDIIDFSSTELKRENRTFEMRTDKPIKGTKFYSMETGNPYDYIDRSGDDNFNQCTTYAHGRFNEIADELGAKKMSDKTHGDAGLWIDNDVSWKTNAVKDGLDITYADDITSFSDLKPGDCLVWKKTNEEGHVGIVEKIDKETGTLYITNGNARKFIMSYTDIDALKGFDNACTYYLYGVIHQTWEDKHE